jgi:hypothetical protein
VWALSKLLPRRQFTALAQAHQDADAAVQVEWAAALDPACA